MCPYLQSKNLIWTIYSLPHKHTPYFLHHTIFPSCLPYNAPNTLFPNNLYIYLDTYVFFYADRYTTEKPVVFFSSIQ